MQNFQQKFYITSSSTSYAIPARGHYLYTVRNGVGLTNGYQLVVFIVVFLLKIKHRGVLRDTQGVYDVLGWTDHTDFKSLVNFLFQKIVDPVQVVVIKHFLSVTAEVVQKVFNIIGYRRVQIGIEGSADFNGLDLLAALAVKFLQAIEVKNLRDTQDFGVQNGLLNIGDLIKKHMEQIVFALLNIAAGTLPGLDITFIRQDGQAVTHSNAAHVIDFGHFLDGGQLIPGDQFIIDDLILYVLYDVFIFFHNDPSYSVLAKNRVLSGRI